MKKKVVLSLLASGMMLGMLGMNGFAEEAEKHLEVSTFWITPSLDFSDSYSGWVCTRIGVGETLEDMQKFDPDAYIDALFA